MKRCSIICLGLASAVLATCTAGATRALVGLNKQPANAPPAAGGAQQQNR
jgi:hypothetical protein